MATFEKRSGKKGISHRAIVRIKGYPVQKKTFSRITDAKLWAQQTEAAIRAGEFQIGKKITNKTFKDLTTRYREEILSTKLPSTAKAESSYLKHWENVFNDYDLNRITPTLVSDEVQKAAKAKSPLTGKLRSKRTIKYYRDTLAFIFKSAKLWGWVTNNPLDSVTPITKLRNERMRFLSDDERASLLEACKESPNKQLYTIAVIALSTGARRGEILNLQIRDVNIETGKAILRNTKNGETRSLPLVNHALSLIKDQVEYAERLYFDKPKGDYPKYLFPNKSGSQPISFRNAWYTAVEASGVTDFKFHDLRHSAASYLAMNGASLLEIAAILGHKTLQMVKRYAHLSEDHTRDIVEKMNAKIF